jgi:hypothetical protein
MVQQAILTARTPKAARITKLKAGMGVERKVVGMRMTARIPKRDRDRIFDARNRNMFSKGLSESDDFSGGFISVFSCQDR